MDKYASIVGWGKYVPDRVMTNGELEEIVDTSDEWIRSRTGITQRHIADENESTATMATRAAREALRVADIPPADLDVIIVATVTPDHFFPATACLVQDALGASKAGAFDLSAGCSGFVYALSVATDMIQSGSYENALVVGSDALSRIVDWNDRATCVLFGDGAGAFVLQASKNPGGVQSYQLGSDGSGGDLLAIPAGGSRRPASEATVAEGAHYVKMDGREVYRFATRIMGRSSKAVIEATGLDIEDVDLIIPHQANYRIIKAAAKYLDVDMDRVFVNVDRYGNTSTASVPIAFCEALEAGRIQPGDDLVLVAFGAGLTWAAATVQWGIPLPAPERPWWVRVRQWSRYRAARVKSATYRLQRKADAWLSEAQEMITGSNGYYNGDVTHEEEEHETDTTE